MLIKRFDTEANRRAWQGFLNTQGEKLQVDGKFGPLTTAATKRFQIASSLSADGIVGENTVSAAMQKGFAGFGQTVPVPAPTSTGKTILVSAGHTNKRGFDQGVIANDLTEGQEAVIMRDNIAHKLRAMGFAVREDGADGVNEPLSKALSLISGTQLAVEIHFNGFANPAATGIEVLSLPNRKAAGQKLAAACHSVLGIPLRGDKGWKSDTEGQHSRIGFCRAGGILIETCFLTNPSDVAKYLANIDPLCKSIAQAIAEII